MLSHGDRIDETVNGARTTFTLDVASSLTQVLAETSGGSTISYLYGLGLVGEMKTSVGMAEYHLTDALGSVRQLTDPGGSVVLSQTFDPYGSLYEQSRGGVLWDATSPFGWTGQQSDPNGLTYLRVRYYNPSMGRFTQLDPFAGALALPSSLNGYAYGHGNPTRYTDPDGLCGPLCWLAIIGGSVLLGVTVGAIAGAGFEMGSQLITYGHIESWELVGMRAAEGAILGGLTALTVSIALAVAPAAATATVFTVGSHTITAAALGAFAVDVAIGAAWDVNVWHDTPGRAIAVNVGGGVLGELGGQALGRVFRGANADRVFARLAKGAEADEIIARRLAYLKSEDVVARNNRRYFDPSISWEHTWQPVNHLGAGETRQFQIRRLHRAGNSQIEIDGQLWNLPPGRQISDIPLADPVGDSMQLAVAQARKEWTPGRLSGPQRDAIARAQEAGEYWRANLLESYYKGQHIERTVRQRFTDLNWSARGVDAIDPRTGIRYEVLAGSQSNIDEHAKRMGDILFRFIAY